jgi:hypothetical protein
MNLTNEPSVHVHNNRSSTAEHNEQSSLDEEQKPVTSRNKSDRQYCLVLFNNPHWSQRLRRRLPQVRKKI